MKSESQPRSVSKGVLTIFPDIPKDTNVSDWINEFAVARRLPTLACYFLTRQELAQEYLEHILGGRTNEAVDAIIQRTTGGGRFSGKDTLERLKQACIAEDAAHLASIGSDLDEFVSNSPAPPTNNDPPGIPPTENPRRKHEMHEEPVPAVARPERQYPTDHRPASLKEQGLPSVPPTESQDGIRPAGNSTKAQDRIPAGASGSPVADIHVDLKPYASLTKMAVGLVLFRGNPAHLKRFREVAAQLAEEARNDPRFFVYRRWRHVVLATLDESNVQVQVQRFKDLGEASASGSGEVAGLIGPTLRNDIFCKGSLLQELHAQACKQALMSGQHPASETLSEKATTSTNSPPPPTQRRAPGIQVLARPRKSKPPKEGYRTPRGYRLRVKYRRMKARGGDTSAAARPKGWIAILRVEERGAPVTCAALTSLAHDHVPNLASTFAFQDEAKWVLHDRVAYDPRPDGFAVACIDAKEAEFLTWCRRLLVDPRTAQWHSMVSIAFGDLEIVPLETKYAPSSLGVPSGPLAERAESQMDAYWRGPEKDRPALIYWRDEVGLAKEEKLDAVSKNLFPNNAKESGQVLSWCGRKVLSWRGRDRAKKEPSGEKQKLTTGPWHRELDQAQYKSLRYSLFEAALTGVAVLSLGFPISGAGSKPLASHVHPLPGWSILLASTAAILAAAVVLHLTSRLVCSRLLTKRLILSLSAPELAAYFPNEPVEKTLNRSLGVRLALDRDSWTHRLNGLVQMEGIGWRGTLIWADRICCRHGGKRGAGSGGSPSMIRVNDAAGPLFFALVNGVLHALIGATSQYMCGTVFPLYLIGGFLGVSWAMRTATEYRRILPSPDAPIETFTSERESRLLVRSGLSAFVHILCLMVSLGALVSAIGRDGLSVSSEAIWLLALSAIGVVLAIASAWGSYGKSTLLIGAQDMWAQGRAATSSLANLPAELNEWRLSLMREVVSQGLNVSKEPKSEFYVVDRFGMIVYPERHKDKNPYKYPVVPGLLRRWFGTKGSPEVETVASLALDKDAPHRVRVRAVRPKDGAGTSANSTEPLGYAAWVSEAVPNKPVES